MHDVTSKPAGSKGSERTTHQTTYRPKPVVFRDRKDIVATPKNKSYIPPPQRDYAGKSLRLSVSYNPPPRTVNVFNDITIVKNVERYNRLERVRGRYYWHHDGGHHICHYYDNAGLNWYGWYIGLDFYWTRWHAGYWWWYDRHYDRWCYWHAGYWWWPRPDRSDVVFVYINNEYRPAEDVPEQAAPEAPEDASAVEQPKAQPADNYFRNKAMNRMVRIYGEDREAFLYDASDKPSFRPIFLASGVKEIQMSDDSTGKPLQILVTKEDGSFEVFDAQGRPYMPSGSPKK